MADRTDVRPSGSRADGAGERASPCSEPQHPEESAPSAASRGEYAGREARDDHHQAARHFRCRKRCPDWQVLTEDSLWVTNRPLNSVHRLDAKTNKIAATIAVGKSRVPDSPPHSEASGCRVVAIKHSGVSILRRHVDRDAACSSRRKRRGHAASEDAVWLVTDPPENSRASIRRPIRSPL